ncbi:MAG: chorismate mutase [Microbacteriaceae bacterium]|nr:chorismate mutase [Microbacteriaceae bacterium]
MSDDALAELSSLRNSIDNIDAALVHLLAERFKCTQQVGRLKASNGMPAADPIRERQQIEKLKALAVESRLDPAFGEKFLNFIIAEVIHQHEQIASTGAIAVVDDNAEHTGKHAGDAKQPGSEPEQADPAPDA